MRNDDFDSYEAATTELSYQDDSVNCKPTSKIDDSLRIKRRRLDDLLEEKRLRSECNAYYEDIPSELHS